MNNPDRPTNKPFNYLALITSAGMHESRERFYWDYFTTEQKVATAEKLLLPTPDMAKIGNFWGTDGRHPSVICAGDHGHMRRHTEKLRADEVEALAAILPIWC